MTISSWPDLLVPTREMWQIVGASTSGGRTLAGTEQAVRSPTGIWRATRTVSTRGRDDVILAFRAFVAALDGRAGEILVGPLDGRRAPWRADPLTGGKLTPANGIGGNADLDPGLSFKLAADAALNATALSVVRQRGGRILPGAYCSIGDRLHIVTSVSLGDGDENSSAITVGIRPWLRAAHGADTPVEFAAPRGLMRLAKDDGGALDLEWARFGQATIELVEAL